MEEKDPIQRLREAAETGKVDDLRVLIQKDAYIFERIDEIPFTDTPLHIAAKEGQIEFAMEMMNLKPSFARKLNPDGFCPMHLAVVNGKTELVLRLLQTDKDLVRVKGTEGMTPFHRVVTMGNSQSQLLVEVLEACPKCIEDVTVRNETALHLALIKNQMKAFGILIGWLQRSTGTHISILDFEKNIVNWTDKDNNTVLHIAAKKGQDEALKLLLDSQLWLNVKAKNSDGLTALKIKEKRETPSIDINMSGKDDDDPKIKQLKKKVNFSRRIKVLADRLKNTMSVEVINTMLVVMALVLTATHQSSLSPREVVRFVLVLELRDLCPFTFSNGIPPLKIWSIWNLCLLVIFEILPFLTLLVLLYVIRKSILQMKAEIQYRMKMHNVFHTDANVGIIRRLARRLAFVVFLLPYILDTIF
ncbi:hypothetical protein J1N35_029336 [Gossypium stocksii]|uniref:PGG domain-containing protein n=1 Tax=Gossypium stocksii TaxID=47602 RepID=A0A9D3UYJ0_9ROSI|nr:hypothetical protein J1N35_029336 [Gossypium stocksii]